MTKSSVSLQLLTVLELLLTLLSSSALITIPPVNGMRSNIRRVAAKASPLSHTTKRQQEDKTSSSSRKDADSRSSIASSDRQSSSNIVNDGRAKGSSRDRTNPTSSGEQDNTNNKKKKLVRVRDDDDDDDDDDDFGDNKEATAPDFTKNVRIGGKTIPGSFTLLEQQPFVIQVEQHPAGKAFGTGLSHPNGSPWCDNQPTFWLTGHQRNETPYCYHPTDGSWQKGTSTVVLDSLDALNVVDSEYIDRHDCVSMDVNYDGLDDILCTVGADSGTGKGYNELYLTRINGTIEKVLTHGFQKYTSMRTRLAATLTGPNGDKLVLLTTNGKPRKDGLPNEHRMFRNTYLEQGSAGGYFEEVPGPWTESLFDVSCILTNDLNGDGLDDLFLCDTKGLSPWMAIQGSDSSWTKVVDYPSVTDRGAQKLRNARIGDVTGDGIPDLVTVGWQPPYQVSVYQGSSSSPYFDLADPVYNLPVPYNTPDIEIVDVNRDEVADIYVVQVHEDDPSIYCGSKDPKAYWTTDTERGVNPGPDWVPPLDIWPDIVLVGSGDASFSATYLNHSIPGCGQIAKTFGNSQTLLLAHGTTSCAGYNVLLQW